MSKEIFISLPNQDSAITKNFLETWTATEVIHHIRNRFLLEGGGLECNNVVVSGSAYLSTLNGRLTFVDASPKQTAGSYLLS
jgi:hypothetical protein